MIRLLQATTENLAQNAQKATLTSISSGFAVWGIELPLFLQMIGVGIAFVSMIIGGLYYYAMWRQRKRELDIEERKLESK